MQKKDKLLLKMKPPRLPGTEKFRFCDKKYEQPQSASSKSLVFGGDDAPDGRTTTTISGSKLMMKNSDFLLSLHDRSLSNESLLCSCPKNHLQATNCDSLLSNGSSQSSCTLEEFICQANLPLPVVQVKHCNSIKRKPNLPISSRLTSRVFNLTNYISHINETEQIYCRSGKANGILTHASCTKDSLTLPRNHFHEGFDCSPPSRCCTPNSLDSNSSSDGSGALHSSNTSPKLSKLSCRIHGPHHATANNLMINSTSHASLMSDESSTSLSFAGHRTTDDPSDDSLLSFSYSPVEHWAKQTVTQNRLSTSSQSSWEDGASSSSSSSSGLHDVT